MPFTNKLKIAEAILIMQAVTIIIVAVFISDLNYGRQVNMANSKALLTITNEVADLIEKQGNISSAQRGQLLSSLAAVNKHGGFATNEDIQIDRELLKDINDTLHSNNITNTNVSRLR